MMTRCFGLLLGLTLYLPAAAAGQVADPPRWRLGEPLQIGVSFGELEYEFSLIGGVIQLTGGMIAVAETQSDEIRFFDRSGSFVRKRGREGEGPGEYLFVQWLGECGPDTVFAVDSRQDRMTVLSAGGDVIRTTSLPSPDPGRGLYQTACDTSGLILSASWPSDEAALRDPDTHAYETTFFVAKGDRDGNVLDTIGEFPGGERVLQIVGGQVRGSRPRQFGTDTFLAAGGGRAYIGYSGRAEVVILEGDRRRSSPLSLERHPIGQQDLEAFRDEAVASAPEARRASERRYWQDYDFPNAYPFFSDLHADPAGNLWVRGYPAVGDEVVEWLVLDPAMNPIGRVVAPVAFEVTDVGIDYLLGVWRDDDDVQYVRRYPVVRARG